MQQIGSFQHPLIDRAVASLYAQTFVLSGLRAEADESASPDVVKHCDTALLLCRRAVNCLEELENEFAGQRSDTPPHLDQPSPSSPLENAAKDIWESALDYTG